MLVLSRRRNEVLRIGDIPVTVVDIRGDKVRLGIMAPDNVPIHREEVYQAIQREAARKARKQEGDTDASGTADAG